ncbi:LCP family protein [Labedaea rhizosphaerae]|uniref:LytR family transcriptional attenuator n=1 Tax=Labedaea rhizosphaerae TaxID=598644 RepID=A0A4R6RYG2_LABRH|nr:LCP family protein [Labedaea rhizosphaerae]TDP92150.1 LytR family transcriptional attenuator [Labedaea rhizosphaerae]
MSYGYGDPRDSRRPAPGRTQKLPIGGQDDYGRPQQGQHQQGQHQQGQHYDEYGRRVNYDNAAPRRADPQQQYRNQYADPYGDEYGEPQRGGPGGPGGPAGPGGVAPAARPRKGRRWGRIVLSVFGVILLLIVAACLYVELSMNRVEAITDYPGRPAEGAGTNWLIVGSDSREGMTAEQEKELSTGDAGGQRTDTIMLMHIPDNDTKPTLVSLLRDSYVDIPGWKKNKLNAAYAHGYAQGKAEGAAQLLVKTVEGKTGLHIDHYMEIGFGGFANLVDDVGGVDICVKKAINDPKAGIKLKAGCQELDGKNALGYVRTRATARADLDRVTHQREFISALTDKATSFGTMINPFRMIPLIADAPDAITVDSGDHLWNLPGLAFAMSGAGDGSLITTTVPWDAAASHNVSGIGSVIEWDDKKAPQFFDDLNHDRAIPADLINSTG